jgi:hypothetical protein
MVEVTAPSLISSEVVEGFTALAMVDKEKKYPRPKKWGEEEEGMQKERMRRERKK